MNHLTDELLNEYLDNEVSDRAAIENHLAACAGCVARLSTLESLFTQLDSLPEAALSRPFILTFAKTLPSRLPRWLTWTVSLQFAVALAVAIIAAPFVSNVLPVMETSAFKNMFFQTQPQWAAGFDMLSNIHMPILPEIPAAEFSRLTVILAGVSILWLLGNGLLLKNHLK